MKRKIKEFILSNNLIDMEYFIPESFKLTNPSYHCSLDSLLGDKHHSKWTLPTVVYCIAKNENGESIDEEYEDDAIFTWSLKDYNPGFFSPTSLEENSHYFKQYLDNKSFNFNKKFNEFIEDAKKKGFTDFSLSIGIWTNDGILNERIIPLSNDVSELANEYSLLSKELNEIYLNSPDVVMYNYSTVFTDPDMLMKVDNKVEVGRYILSSMMSKELKKGFKQGKELFIGDQFVLVSKLNTCTPKLLKTSCTLVQPNDKDIKLNFENFTIFLVNAIGKEKNIDFFDTDENRISMDDIHKETLIEVYHEFTDYLSQLREMKFK